MSTCVRNGRKWTVNEILNLQREYELLELDIEEIASNHQRSEMAILCKLVSEGWMDESYIHQINNNNNNIETISNDSQPVDNSEFVNFETLDMRVYKLECAVNDISHLIEESLNRTSLYSSRKPNKLYN